MIETLAALIQACSPQVAPDTMLKFIDQQSGGYPYVLQIEGRPETLLDYDTAEEAEIAAIQLISSGNKINIGLGQVSSRYLSATLSIQNLLDPCQNLDISSKILTHYYQEAVGIGVKYPYQTALAVYNSPSSYSTGSNGYLIPSTKKIKTKKPAPKWDAFTESGSVW